MAEATLIAWTDHTFNPWMGCFKVSAGCKHCYAERLTIGKMQLDVFGPNTAKRQRTGKSTWANPRRWNREAAAQRRAHRVFCASLADVFEDAPGPNEWRQDVWKLIRSCPWLDFQILTKRPENIAKMLPDDWDLLGTGFWPNVWLGTSIENNEVAERAAVLIENPAIVHFISYEPAIGPGDKIPLTDIEWMIFGGESGPGFRPMQLSWAEDMWGRCRDAGVAFFYKQSAAFRTEMGIRALGRIVREYPPAWGRGI